MIATAEMEAHYHDWSGNSDWTYTMHQADCGRFDFLAENIPDEPKSYRQEVVWKSEDHGKPKRDKVPYNPRTGYRAKSNDPQTWGTFAEALAAYRHGGFDGIG